MKNRCLTVVCILLLARFPLSGQESSQKQSLNRKNLLNDFQYFTINNIFSFYMNTMQGATNLATGQGPGFEYPKGSGKYLIYADGFVYGGYFHSSNLPVRRFANGSTHNSGFQEGSITVPGTGIDNTATGANAIPELPGALGVRVYRVRPDMNPYDARFTRAQLEEMLQNEEALLIQRFQSRSAAQIYDRYKQDWDEWPWQKGAPWKDIDQNGVYEPSIDIPGIPSAGQTLWHTCNDMSISGVAWFSGGLPVGIEFQRTIWGYKRPPELAEVLFMRFRLINKSGASLDTMLVGLWSDPDLGYFGDDLAGCDTTHSLGFCYNAKEYDLDYGYQCPAVGYRVVQGPVVPGEAVDSAAFDLRHIHGKKNLRIYSFGPPYGFSVWEPFTPYYPQTYLYNRLKGLHHDGSPWVDPDGNQTRYPLAGDPVTGKGWLDSYGAHGDVSMTLSAGPFSMAPMDTQEVVFAALVGQGADRLSSITTLRAVSDLAQTVAELNFDMAEFPPPPFVNVTTIDGGVILTWGDPAYVREVEHEYSSKGYTFEGYKVYQASGPSFKDAKIAATYDIVDPVLDNNGVRHSVTITQDRINSKPLINGTQYFFGVTAVVYSLQGPVPVLETEPTIVPVIPQTLSLGNEFQNQPGDSIAVVKTTSADAMVRISVGDPLRTKTGLYTLSFPASGKMNLRCESNGKDTLLFADFPLTRGAQYPDEYGTSEAGPVVEGLTVNVSRVRFDPPSTYLRVVVNPPGSGLLFGGTGKELGLADGYYTTVNGLARPLNTRRLVPTLQLRFTGVKARRPDGSIPVDTSIVQGGQYVTLWPRNSLGAVPAGGHYHRTLLGPFELWDIENGRQVNCAIVDGNHDGGSAWGDSPSPSYDGPYYARLKGRMLIVVLDSDYNPVTAPLTTVDPNDTANTWLLWFREESAGWNLGDEVTVSFVHPVLPEDSYTFAVTGATIGDMNVQRAQAEEVNVYPNPYFAYNALEVSRTERFVTFTHLPQRATLRIIDLSGTVVRTLLKEGPTQFFRWDLKNEAGYPIASGVYLVCIDMPDIRLQKVIKVAVILRQQILNRY